MTTLLLVHAHPDDESILTGGVMAHAHRTGYRVVLVTATRGEEGEMHNMDEGFTRPQLADIRSAELETACEVLGVDRQVFLGYRDSGMDGTSRTDHAEAFSVAPLAEARDRLAVLLREETPDVVVTYTADGTYGHPDHRQAHDTTVAAIDLLDAEGWTPRKVYAHAVSRSSAATVVEAAHLADIVLPEGLAQMQGIPDEEITTVVDVSDVLDLKLAACVAHRSQMHPGLPLAMMVAQVFEAAFGIERFVLMRGELAAPHPEPSLFAGLNQHG